MRNPFIGFARLWLGNTGSANFSLTTLVLMIMSGGLLVFAADKPNLADGFALMNGLAIVSISAAISLQLQRLQAMEGCELIPQFKIHILTQSLVIYLAVIGMCSVTAWCYFDEFILARLMVSISIGLSFIVLCIQLPAKFNLSIIAFGLIAITETVALSLRFEWIAMVTLVLFLVCCQQAYRIGWHPEALTAQEYGTRTAWLSVPNISGAKQKALDAWLFPCNFFIGKILSQTLILLPILYVILEGANQYFEWQFPTLLVLAQSSLMLYSLIHWSRVQHSQAFELLFMLPAYDGIIGLRQNFLQSQHRLVLILTVYNAVFVAGSVLLFDTFSWPQAVHIALLSYWGGLLILGVGSFAHRQWHLVLSLLTMVVVFVTLQLSVEAMTFEHWQLAWPVMDVGLIVLSYWLHKLGSHRLFTYEQSME